MANSALPYHHDAWLVGLSLAIAVLASYAALELAGRLQTASARARHAWLAAAAIAMGGGIWSMHFIAMLAFQLGVPVDYDVATTLLSLLVAVLVTGFGFHVVHRQQGNAAGVLVGGGFMGGGIASMHYIGMAAMQLEAEIHYDRGLVLLSIAIAVSAASAALWLAFRLERIWPKIVSAVVMGGAISGMHFTGMAAASYVVLAPIAPHAAAHARPWIASGVTATTLVVLVLALAASFVQRRVSRAEREAALVGESDRRFRALLHNASDLIAILDETDIVVYESAAADRILGPGAGTLLGRSLVDLAPPRARGAMADLLANARAGRGREAAREVVVLGVDGGERWAELTVADLRADPSVGGLVANLRNITERKEIEARALAERLRAERANRAKSEFLAKVSHELRTPLNAIIGFSEIMRDELFGPVANPRYRTYIDDIHKSGGHLLALINDLLDLSKAAAGRIELVEETVDVTAEMLECIRIVRGRAATGGVAIVAAAPPGTIALRADPLRLRQMVINLLSNAIKFTPDGGSVTLSAAETASGEIAIEVADSGIGMDPGEVAVALAEFGQVQNALTRKYEGTGLGLPLTRHLVELHGGRLELDSARNAGTRVTLWFPAARRVVEDLPSAGVA